MAATPLLPDADHFDALRVAKWSILATTASGKQVRPEVYSIEPFRGRIMALLDAMRPGGSLFWLAGSSEGIPRKGAFGRFSSDKLVLRLFSGSKPVFWRGSAKRANEWVPSVVI